MGERLEQIFHTEGILTFNKFMKSHLILVIAEM